MLFSGQLQPPAVVAPVVSSDDLDAVAAGLSADVCDILEFRLDDLARPGSLLNRAIDVMSTAPGFPLLATVRSPAEGGSHNLDAAAQAHLYDRVLLLVAAIDIEIGSVNKAPGAGIDTGCDALKAVITRAKDAGVTVVLSFHDFQVFPGIETIRQKIDDAIGAGAHIAKIAVWLENESDLLALEDLCRTESRLPLSIMGMGPLGKESRVRLAKAGSVLNYGFLKHSNAPGQWPAAELKRKLASGRG